MLPFILISAGLNFMLSRARATLYKIAQTSLASNLYIAMERSELITQLLQSQGLASCIFRIE